jgi:hypothetical protein
MRILLAPIEIRRLARGGLFLILSSSDLCDPRLHGRRSPAWVAIKRKRGYGGAGWDMPAEQRNRLHMTFGRPLRGILVQPLLHFLLEQEPHFLSWGVWPEKSAFHGRCTAIQ